MQTLQPHGEYRVATQGLDHDTKGSIHEPARLIKIARKADFDTRPRQYAQAGLRGRVAHVPSREVLFVDALEKQRRFAYICGTRVGAGQPGEYHSSAMLQLIATQDGLLQR